MHKTPITSAPKSINDRTHDNSLSVDQGLIESAMLKSPTGGNSKPFSWIWENGLLKISHHQELDTHYLNRKFHTSYLALGCLLMSIEIAAYAQGLIATFKISEADRHVEVKFIKSASGGNLEDLAGLLKRTTERNPFAPSAVPKLESHLTDVNSGIKLVSSDDVISKMKKYVMQADFYLWLQKNATRDFFRELNFKNNGTTSENRGIQVTHLGISRFDQGFLALLRHRPSTASILARIPGFNVAFKAASKRSLKNSHLLLVTTKDVSAASLIKAGQASMKAWVSMEKQGYKMQPISVTSVPVLDAAVGVLPADTQSFYRHLFSKVAPEIFKEQFNLSDGEQVVWMFRVGKTK